MSKMLKSDIGLIGLGVMGRNLALNIADHNYRLTVYNRSVERTYEFIKGSAKGSTNILPVFELKDFIESLSKPRKIILMVKAGNTVDAIIEQLLPYVEQGDIIIDGGNSHFIATKRRESMLYEKGIYYVGAGISGGAQGARYGPSIMPGGAKQAWFEIKDLLTSIAARNEKDEPCCAYIGPEGAGHFVKMVHNGLEYGDLQLIAESYHIMRELFAMNVTDTAKVFHDWSKGELASYLIEITAVILEYIDQETGKPLVEMILDSAEQKGTGKWTSQQALELGVSVPIITEAVYARFISSLKTERIKAASLFSDSSPKSYSLDINLDDLKNALFAAKVSLYAQGFVMLYQASEQYNWELDLEKITVVWSNGCIIRARLLDKIKQAFARNKNLTNLIVDDYFKDKLISYEEDWRKVTCAAIWRNIPVPGLSSGLAYFDTYRTERLPMNLIQAQRDFFGEHTYKRIDSSGCFHTLWE